MKKKNNKLFLFLASILVLAWSCGDMDSIHQDYLDGEEVYAGKLDTLRIRPGYYRAQLEGQTQFLGELYSNYYWVWWWVRNLRYHKWKH